MRVTAPAIPAPSRSDRSITSDAPASPIDRQALPGSTAGGATNLSSCRGVEGDRLGDFASMKAPASHPPLRPRPGDQAAAAAAAAAVAEAAARVDSEISASLGNATAASWNTPDAPNPFAELTPPGLHLPSAHAAFNTSNSAHNCSTARSRSRRSSSTSCNKSSLEDSFLSRSYAMHAAMVASNLPKEASIKSARLTMLVSESLLSELWTTSSNKLDNRAAVLACISQRARNSSMLAT
mmetsp:Transcript_118079/g.338727  ORF Transcript_118079/g.338727 Transcript_118079/m.338727 type:complete len:238 (+) Transcript_118079:41-754(+)